MGPTLLVYVYYKHKVNSSKVYAFTIVWI